MTEVTGLVRNDNVRGLYNEIPAARAPHLTFCGALHRKRRDLIIATPHGREFPKGEGAHALSLWTLQEDRIFKGRGKFGIPLPLNGVFGYFCRWRQKYPAGGKTNEAPPVAGLQRILQRKFQRAVTAARPLRRWVCREAAQSGAAYPRPRARRSGTYRSRAGCCPPPAQGRRG